MRVLQVNTERTWRGGERQTLYTVEGLLEARVEVDVLCLAGCPLQRALDGYPVEVRAVGSQFAAAMYLAGPAARLYDLIHVQTARGQSLAVFTRWLHGRPVLYTRRVNFKPKSALARLKYRHTDQVVAISRAIAETLVSVGLEGVEVVSSAVKQKTLDSARAEDFARKHRLANLKVIATTGDMVPQKDPATMVETIGHLAAMRNDFVFLHFGNQQMLDQLRPRIDELCLGDCYRLLGHHDRVEDYFQLFDVFLISSNETEGLCSSIYDAFVYGVPVVSTLTGGMHDSVADRGLTCGPREPECLARQIARVLDDPDLASNMTDRARKWALAEVAIPAITQRYLDIYKRLVERFA